MFRVGRKKSNSDDIHSKIEDQKEIFIGGLDEELKDGLKQVLTKKGFNISILDKFVGKEKVTICNRGQSKEYSLN